METTMNLGLWDTFKYKFFNDKSYSSRRKAYNTLWAIFFGFIISGLIISFTGNNPFLVFASLFKQGTTTFGNKLISVFVAYIFASLAVAICFKGGLFNIGISGQMMGAGFTTLLIFRSELLTKSQISASSFILAFFIAILTGTFIALLAGVLKSLFGINEVVSTIMLNWVIFFIIKYFIFDLSSFNGKTFLGDTDSLASNLSVGYILPSFFYPQNQNYSWYANYWNWIIIVFGLLMIATIWFILSKTTLGYKIKMVGFNKDASEYSGTNQKSLTLIVMAMSGALSGIAGFIWYTGQGGQMDVAEQPLLAGFDAIAISLLVFNNPISIVFSSLLYSILSIGSNGLATEFAGMQKEINQVIIGAFIYCAAITVVFSKLNVYTWTKRFIILCRYKEYWEHLGSYWKQKFKFIFSKFATWKELIQLKHEHKNEWKQITLDHKNKIKQLENELSHQNYFDVRNLSESKQLFYFDQLAQFKRIKDNELAKASYFETNAIKSKRVVEFKQHQKDYYELKQALIKRYLDQKEAKKIAKTKGGV